MSPTSQRGREKGEAEVPDHDLVRLMSTVARLTHPRCKVPRAQALGKAHERIRRFAAEQGMSEEWCDRVFMLFLDRSTDAYAAA
jgi:hypothetical protein